MTLGRKKRGWTNGDPPGSEKPRGKARSKQMGRYDGSYTPSEQRLKDRLMKLNFCRLEASNNSAAFRAGYDRIDWGKS